MRAVKIDLKRVEQIVNVNDLAGVERKHSRNGEEGDDAKGRRSQHGEGPGPSSALGAQYPHHESE